ncbi:hypothetical protein [Paenibacillus sp. FSL K6-2524]|uniref:hypothetical protein n=1 Tax=Paenibacillus sp. FSL K6-2524 TaxID=2954516 RepID=UPI0030F54F33
MHFNNLNWYEIIELSYLEDLKTLFEETQRTWKSNLDEIGEEIDRLDEEDKDEYVDYHYDIIIQMRETLPRITNNSILINIYSFFEVQMIDFYNDVKSKLSSDVNARHLTDKLNYLNESFGSEVVTKDEIAQLDFVRELRNRIMHSNGVIEKKDFTELVNKIEECSHIKLSDRKEIILDNDFIIKLFEIVEDVLRNLNRCVKSL